MPRITSIVIVLIVLLFTFTIVNAQENTPTIVNFETNLALVTPSQAESGAFPVILTWETEGMRINDVLQLQVFVLNQWINALPEDADPLLESGSREHIVPHTLDFASPRLRLVIFDQTGTILDLQELIIPYANPPEPVGILEFNTDTLSLNASDLINRTASVPISWDVRNRPINSNLVFEQIFADGRVINVEFPRDYLWIRSNGVGAIRPALPDGDLVQLRLHLRDINSNFVYASAELDLPVVYPSATPIPAETSEILFFEANTAFAQPNDTITLSWASVNAQRVYIEVITFVPCCEGTTETEVSQVYEDLPANGSLDVVAPAFGASVTYRLILDTYTPVRGTSATITITLSNDTIITVSGAYQPFENGMMLWQGNNGTIWVLFNDGQALLVPESAYANLPNNPITDTPPENYVSPISGFGRVWGNNEDIRVALGWGLSGEQSYNMVVERVSAIANGAVNFLINLPDGRRVLIRDSGYWGFQPQP